MSRKSRFVLKPELPCTNTQPILAKSSNAPEHPDNQEPTRPDKPDGRQHRHTVQHDTHINHEPRVLRRHDVRRRRRLAVALARLLQPTHVQHDGREAQVAKDPREHDDGAEALVVILVLLGVGDGLLGRRVLGVEGAELGFVLGVEVGVVGGDADVDLAAGFDVGGGQLFGIVVAFRAPGDVVCVAEGVDVENVYIGRRKEEILEEL